MKRGDRAVNDTRCARCPAEAVPPYVYCMPCKRAYDKNWRTENPEAARRNKRNGHLSFRYGITIAEWDAMWERQRGLCDICSAAMEDGRHGANKVCVDHDHDTGVVRGLLCSLCNVGLGSFRDDIQSLERAAEYLRRHTNAQVGIVSTAA